MINDHKPLVQFLFFQLMMYWEFVPNVDEEKRLTPPPPSVGLPFHSASFASYTNTLRSDSGRSQAIWPWSHWILRWVVSSGSGLSVCAMKQNLHWSGPSHLSLSFLLRPARDWHIHTGTNVWVRESEREMKICYLNLSSCLLSPPLDLLVLNTWIWSVRASLWSEPVEKILWL